MLRKPLQGLPTRGLEQVPYAGAAPSVRHGPFIPLTQTLPSPPPPPTLPGGFKS